MTAVSRPPHRKRWENMVERCHSPKHKDYPHYGARGIRVCAAWRKDWRVFQAWCFATYEEGKTLDRKNNDGHYTPRNCTWSTPLEQAQNRRKGTQEFLEGRTKAKATWASKRGDPKTRTHKKCGRCAGTFPVSNFHKNKSNPSDGLQTRCKPCGNRP